jgi:hypothetical protein
MFRNPLDVEKLINMVHCCDVMHVCDCFPPPAVVECSSIPSKPYTCPLPLGPPLE